MDETTKGEKLQKELMNEKRNGWDFVSEEKREEIFKFSEEYKYFLNQSKTEREVVAFAKDINMIPLVLQKEQPGYILNSMLVPFLESAEMLWAKGVADPETIDLTWKLATSAPAGPFQIMDIVGLKTCYDIVSMKEESKDENSVYHKVTVMLKEKLDKGEGGVNSGKGFYDYTKK